MKKLHELLFSASSENQKGGGTSSSKKQQRGNVDDDSSDQEDEERDKNQDEEEEDERTTRKKTKSKNYNRDLKKNFPEDFGKYGSKESKQTVKILLNKLREMTDLKQCRIGQHDKDV